MSIEQQLSLRAKLNGEYLDSLETMPAEEITRKYIEEHDKSRSLRNNPNSTQLDIDIQKQREIWCARAIIRRIRGDK